MLTGVYTCQNTTLLKTHAAAHLQLSTTNWRADMGHVARKPVFGVSDKASFKPVCSATKTN